MKTIVSESSPDESKTIRTFQLRKEEVLEIGKTVEEDGNWAFATTRKEIRSGLKFWSALFYTKSFSGRKDTDWSPVDVSIAVTVGCQTFTGQDALDLIQWAFKK